MSKVTVEREIGGQKLSLTTGDWAKQASGAVRVQYGETVLFVAAQSGPARPGIDFFPLQVDYRERLAASGKFAGGFLKREGRPTTREILAARLTDRPIRPLFPEGYKDELQVLCNVLAADPENDPDALTILGASAAIMLSPVPFQGPIGGLRVGLIDDEFVVLPTIQQMKESKLDLIVAGSRESVLMIEGFGEEIPEQQMADAIAFAHSEIQKLCDLQDEFVKKVGVEPVEWEAPPENPFEKMLKNKAYSRIKKAKMAGKKQERHGEVAEIRQEFIDELFPDDATETEDGDSLNDFKDAFYKLERQAVRDLILEGKRLDGRKPADLRPVSCEVGVLPRVHGSAVFTRGETQSLGMITLGTARDQQRVDGLYEEISERFMLHYYFPSFSVGEVRPIRGPGRREIGHGMLAQRSVEPILPTPDKFPYTIRAISDILESNGSSSMATVCSATLSMMDAGVPLQQPVAGISIGIVMESESKYTLLTDIMGDEDHYGDMDFKVAGTQRGITGIQLDLKNSGITEEIVRATLTQARQARIQLLKTMLTTIRRPRGDISDFAPRLRQVKIDPEKIGLLIGPGGKTIRAMQENSGAQIDIQDDGTVTIAANNGESAAKALAAIEAMTEEIKVGRIYAGTVSSIKDFGAFIEIAPGKDGLCHISELADGFVKNVSDVVKVGDQIDVKVIAVDEQNRVKLSRKAVVAEQNSDEESDD
ncbi:polyribonucleotide nucleotidyltransferase [Thalassoroseus pseudoceratinae]|nr:polyribonucleotide nucleotidyltransferase [Thalassoroseus pseudoceratinae]